MEAIVCRSSEQIYEDNVLELHTRLTAWTRELANERCFTPRECPRKAGKLVRMRALIAGVESGLCRQSCLQRKERMMEDLPLYEVIECEVIEVNYGS